MVLPLPALSAFDPGTASNEGSVDPLGLYAISDRLATILAPGVRERQRQIRFLTVLAVSLDVCRDFPPDTVAADGLTPPWQVFEWFFVEALVRWKKGEGVPGNEKTARALRDGLPLNARRYLKTPGVSGFHGIYRTLAKELDVERAGYLGVNGLRLREVWEKEQDLVGSNWRTTLERAVRAGFERGATYNAAGAFELLANHLAPQEAGREELRCLLRMLRAGDTGYRREVFEFVMSAAGQRILREDDWDERRFHIALMNAASPGLRELLKTIQAYEALAALLVDAWDECLHALTVAWRGLRASDLARLDSVARAVKQVREAYIVAQERLAKYGLAERAHSFQELAEPASAAEWVEKLYAHHDRVQREKPPAGKAPWVIRYDDGRYLVRPQYRIEEFSARNGSQYIYFYRTRPLNDFARDLQMVA